MLTKEEVEEFMREADVVSSGLKCQLKVKYSCTYLGIYLFVYIYMYICTFLCFIFYFQDGNGKLDYDEFVKMMLQY